MDSSDEWRKRDEGRNKQIERIKKNLREPDVFENGEILFLQDTEGKWTIRATVINRRKHQGVESSSYMLKKSKTGHMTCRNECAIRRFEGGLLDNDADTSVGSKEDTSRTGNNSSMNINTPSCPSLI